MPGYQHVSFYLCGFFTLECEYFPPLFSTLLPSSHSFCSFYLSLTTISDHSGKEADPHGPGKG